jgi:Zn-dependent peptidase ImmA (M78 family)
MHPDPSGTIEQKWTFVHEMGHVFTTSKRHKRYLQRSNRSGQEHLCVEFYKKLTLFSETPRPTDINNPT